MKPSLLGGSRNMVIRVFGFALLLAGLCATQSLAQSSGISLSAAPAPASLATEGKDRPLPFSQRQKGLLLESSQLHQLPPLAPDTLPTDPPDAPRRIGVVRQLAAALDPLVGSTLVQTADGQARIMRVQATGAVALRIHFIAVNLPPGSRLFVHAAGGSDELYGPFTGHGPDGTGEFWSPPVTGDTAIIEYDLEKDAAVDSQSPFAVSEVSHIFRDPLSAFVPDGAAGPCNLEVTSAWAETAKSVGHLQFTTSEGDYLCTGTLLNSDTGEPYLLTANHCFNTQSSAQSLRVYWFYNSGDFPGGSSRTDGAQLLATGATTDFTFVKLTGSRPAGLMLSGWTTSVPAIGTSVTSIHHPLGSHKRISFGHVVSASTSFLTVRWDSGVTEHGSSGGGLWVGQGTAARLIGQLRSGSSSCSNLNGTDNYGRFDVTYNSIAQWLRPNGGCGNFTLSATNSHFGVGGGTLCPTVNGNSNCAWTATSNTSWITINNGNNGSGNGSVCFSVASNGAANERTGTLTIANQTFTVTQSGLASDLRPLAIGASLTGSIPAPAPNEGLVTGWQYTVQVPSGVNQLNIFLTGNQDVDLHVSFGHPVTVPDGYLTADYNSDSSAIAESLIFNSTNAPRLQPGTYYIAVSNWGTGAANFTINATTGAVPNAATVSAASFSNSSTLSRESIAAVFGSNLATATALANTQPLPRTLANTTVKVRDSSGVEFFSRLFFVASGQVNYLIPGEAANGPAFVTVTSSNGTLSAGMIQIATVAPALFTASANGQGVPAGIALRVKPGGRQISEPLSRFDAATNRYVPVPVNLSPATDRVFLVLFGTGWRSRSSLTAVRVTINNLDAPVSYAGPQNDFAGLDQINAEIPRSLAGSGSVLPVQLTVDGRAANPLTILISINR